jgi:hypothetical protein
VAKKYVKRKKWKKNSSIFDLDLNQPTLRYLLVYFEIAEQPVGRFESLILENWGNFIDFFFQ